MLRLALSATGLLWVRFGRLSVLIVTTLSLLLDLLVVHDFVSDRCLILPLDFYLVFCLSLFELPVDLLIAAEFDPFDDLRIVLISDHFLQNFAVKLEVSSAQVLIKLLLNISGVHQSILLMISGVATNIDDTTRLLVILNLNILGVVTLEFLNQKFLVIWNVLNPLDFPAVNDFWILSFVAWISLL